MSQKSVIFNKSNDYLHALLRGQVVTVRHFWKLVLINFRMDRHNLGNYNQTVPNVGDEVSIKGQPQFQSIPVSGQI
jgi:hypothetical protein